MSRSLVMAAFAGMIVMSGEVAAGECSRAFQARLIQHGGDQNHAVVMLVVPASYGSSDVQRNGDSRSIAVVSSNQGGVTGIWIAGQKVSSADPSGVAVTIDVIENIGVEVFYDGISQAAGFVLWGEENVRFWFRVNSGGSAPEDVFGVFDDYEVDGTTIDDFSGNNGEAPNAALWNVFTNGVGTATIQSSRLHMDAETNGGQGVVWVEHTATYDLLCPTNTTVPVPTVLSEKFDSFSFGSGGSGFYHPAVQFGILKFESPVTVVADAKVRHDSDSHAMSMTRCQLRFQRSGEPLIVLDEGGLQVGAEMWETTVSLGGTQVLQPGSYTYSLYVLASYPDLLPMPTVDGWIRLQIFDQLPASGIPAVGDVGLGIMVVTLLAAGGWVLSKRTGMGRRGAS